MRRTYGVNRTVTNVVGPRGMLNRNKYLLGYKELKGATAVKLSRPLLIEP